MNTAIKMLRLEVKDALYCEHIICKVCNSTSKPIGLGVTNNNKIQLFRECRLCGRRTWYWVKTETCINIFKSD